MADAAVEAADEQHRRRDARGCQDRGVVAGARRELDQRQAAALELLAQRRDRTLGHRAGLEAKAGLDLERGDEPVEALAVGRAEIDRDAHPARDDVGRSGLDVELADGADGAVDPRREVAHAEDVLGRRDERVGAALHRHRAGMTGFALEDPLAADDPDDSLREPERHARAFEHRSLLDVDLEETRGQVPALDEGRAADTAALLVAEYDSRALPDALDRLDRSDDTQRAVELASAGDGVEVRSRPDRGIGGAADQVACIVDLDLEPGLLHPPGRELVRAILTVAAADTVCTDDAAAAGV